jgi:uncharacterized membrane protein
METTMTWIDVLYLATALGAALIAGAFFAFSNFIMRALGQQPAPNGIAAMNAINITVLNPKFLGIFTGTAALGAGIVILALFGGSLFAAAGALVYIVGTFGVTMALNVPMNDALAQVEPESAEGASYWSRYLKDWVFWNTVRTAAALLATLLLIIALTL